MEASVAAVPGIIRDKPAAEPTFLGHPRGLALLFLVEMWERFSYYGMRALLVLYLVNALKWDTARASNLYGSYTSLAYITPLLGGYLADRFLGTRRSLVIGGILIACGHFSLALTGTATFYLGLALVIMGTGFFKPNVSTMVGQLYPEGDSRRDGGFTLFYMGINLGAFLAPLICGYLGERVGWHYGFGAAGVGMVLGLALYLWGRDKYLPGIGVGAPAARKLHVETSARSADDKKRVAALVIVVLFVVAFWSAFEQSGSSMNLFADKNTNRMVGSFLIPASWFQTVNAGFILLLAPLFAFMWRRLSSAGREPSTPMKMVFGLALLGIGFLFMVIGGRLADAGALVSPFWLIATYFLHTTGELCLSPVGLSYVTKVAPLRLASVLMAGWFLANGAGNKIAGSLAALSGSMSHASFFTIFFVTSMTAAALLFFLVPRINRLTAGVKL
ncbi:MAG TPA: peptide MFS transporter [Gemmatimonadaceae bacterium]|nr:peptide MFS transporter [Gemmatimonadaceae bacterium]